jgi:hypothetical protein
MLKPKWNYRSNKICLNQNRTTDQIKYVLNHNGTIDQIKYV